MAVIFIVEDGTAKDDATSLASLADSNIYHEASVHTDDAWAALSDPDKQQALITATRVIDFNWLFDGARVTSTQALPWPRNGVQNQERQYSYHYNINALTTGLFGRLGGYYGYAELIPNNVVPKRVIMAVCEYALQIKQTNRVAEASTKGVTNFSLGQGALVFAFDKTDRAEALSEHVSSMLMPFGRPAGSQKTAVPLHR